MEQSRVPACHRATREVPVHKFRGHVSKLHLTPGCLHGCYFRRSTRPGWTARRDFTPWHIITITMNIILTVIANSITVIIPILITIITIVIIISSTVIVTIVAVTVIMHIIIIIILTIIIFIIVISIIIVTNLLLLLIISIVIISLHHTHHHNYQHKSSDMHVLQAPVRVNAQPERAPESATVTLNMGEFVKEERL